MGPPPRRWSGREMVSGQTTGKMLPCSWLAFIMGTSNENKKEGAGADDYIRIRQGLLWIKARETADLLASFFHLSFKNKRSQFPLFPIAKQKLFWSSTTITILQSRRGGHEWVHTLDDKKEGKLLLSSKEFVIILKGFTRSEFPLPFT